MTSEGFKTVGVFRVKAVKCREMRVELGQKKIVKERFLLSTIPKFRIQRDIIIEESKNVAQG